MDCRTTPAVDFKRRLGFKQRDSIMTQEQSVLTKLDTFFKTEGKLFQRRVLGYRIDRYVPKYKLAIEVDELGHCTRDIKSEIERQNKIEKELDCKFIRTDPKKSIKDKISDVLLDLEFKKNNSTKTKCLKWIVKKVLPKI